MAKCDHVGCGTHQTTSEWHIEYDDEGKETGSEYRYISVICDCCNVIVTFWIERR